ncbi:MAG: DUF5131 family protein [Desulfobacterales bacterium]|nr:DUF5131 family protein [Desulfobacterales bacterium]
MSRNNQVTNLSTHRWEPWTGCSKISKGCENCWAHYSLKVMKKKYPFNEMADPFNFRVHEDQLDINNPLFLSDDLNIPKRIWVTDRSDSFFDQKIDDKFLLSNDLIFQTFEIMGHIPTHRFILCTKRSKRLADLGPQLPWKPCIWSGVTIESSNYMERLDALKTCGALNKFIIFEPLLEKIPEFDPKGIDLIVVGGEAGPAARPMEAEWVRHLRDITKKAGISFLFKHWSSFGTKGGVGGNKENVIDGRRWEEYPDSMLTNKDYIELWKKQGYIK